MAISVTVSGGLNYGYMSVSIPVPAGVLPGDKLIVVVWASSDGVNSGINSPGNSGLFTPFTALALPPVFVSPSYYESGFIGYQDLAGSPDAQYIFNTNGRYYYISGYIFAVRGAPVGPPTIKYDGQTSNNPSMSVLYSAPLVVDCLFAWVSINSMFSQDAIGLLAPANDAYNMYAGCSARTSGEISSGTAALYSSGNWDIFSLIFGKNASMAMLV